MSSITIRGIERVAQRLAVTRIIPAIEAGCFAVAEELQNELAEYPQASKKKQPFKSEKQRRYVWLIAKGKIKGKKIPYKRSGNLGQRWKPRRIRLGAILANNSGYATYVYGMPQAAYHRGTWPNVETAVNAMRPRVPGILRAALEDVL